MGIAERIKSSPTLKRWVHRMIHPRNQSRPRRWVRWFVNPFVHARGRHTRIAASAMLDVMPYRAFSIGQECTIEGNAVINNGVGPVHIGDHSFIGISNVIIGPVEIGNHVMFAQHVVVSGLNHGYEDIRTPIWKQKCSTATIVIEDECWIGANAVITAGVRIGKHSVVAGGSVVTKDVPPYSVVAGNPARLLKQYNPASGLWEKVNTSSPVIA